MSFQLHPMHNIKANFVKILKLAKDVFKPEVNVHLNFKSYPRMPKCSDLEIIAMAVSADAIGIDSENYLFGKLRSDYPSLYKRFPDRSNYNRRRRKLMEHTDRLSSALAIRMIGQNTDFIVDSMPLPVCRFARTSRLKILKNETGIIPQIGYSAIDKTYFNGYKLHLLSSEQGVIKSFCLSQANVHDIKMLEPLTKEFITDCVLIGDKGYISKVGQLDLFNSNKIDLITPSRNNQSAPSSFSWSHRKKRKRIETVFSQFCDQLMIKRNYAKSFDGYYCRILSKIAAFTSLQYINFRNEKPLNKIKYALAA